jgi:pimeloyl-ACP methyl ester carboxylesterase
MQVNPFRIDVSAAEVNDLRDRLERTRWAHQFPDAGWTYGTDQRYLRELVGYWKDEFDWPAQERRLNGYPQFRCEVEGLQVHFVHRRGRGTGAIPLLLLHGWPGSFVQMLDLVDRLTDGDTAATPASGSFDVVAASLPGFGFSDPPDKPGLNEAGMARMFHTLMTQGLGYQRFAVHGSDFGQGIMENLAALFPESVIATHTGGTSPHASSHPDLTPAEEQYVNDVAHWRKTEVGYGQLQGTRPDTLAPALTDSPAGLASWLVEKFRRWSDCDGEIERRFTKDQLLTNIAVYWFSRSIASSIRLYAEPVAPVDLRDSPVPAAYLMSPKDMFRTPREWVARTNRIDRWTEIDRGGHFLEWEEPDLVAHDLRAFVHSI